MAQLSWQITVTTAGTAVQGPSTPPGFYKIQALPTNSGNVYIGNDGTNDVSSSTGFILEIGDTIEKTCDTLEDLWFDAATNGDKFAAFLIQSAEPEWTEYKWP